MEVFYDIHIMTGFPLREIKEFCSFISNNPCFMIHTRILVKLFGSVCKETPIWNWHIVVLIISLSCRSLCRRSSAKDLDSPESRSNLLALCSICKRSQNLNQDPGLSHVIVFLSDFQILLRA
jgi:hypothetical protein